MANHKRFRASESIENTNTKVNMSNPSVLALPFPAQGHITPMISLSQKLVEKGCNIIFVNSDFIHERVVRIMEKEQSLIKSPLKFVSISDGLPVEDERNDYGELFLSILRTMPAMLEKLIEDLDIRICCIIADAIMGWGLDVARKLGIKGALFSPASAAMLALQFNIPNLIDEGIIDSQGLPARRKTFQLSPSMPTMDTRFLWWTNVQDSVTQKKIFNYLMHCWKTPTLTQWCLCNTASELEPGARSCVPNLLPIGPLLSETSVGQFWEEDLSCMSWLDQQPHRSVVYVAFGSLTLFDQKHFTELALALDLTNRPFLWVVRQDYNCKYNMCFPNEFKGNRGKIVGWAPQQKVLSHPAIACFVSHCGWNSTLEGLSNGVPFLCWPYSTDQFFDKTLICDELKVGLGFDLDENEVISCWEVKAKVDQLMNDEGIRSRSHKLKEKLKKNIEEGGRSSEILCKFVNWLKE